MDIGIFLAVWIVSAVVMAYLFGCWFRGMNNDYKRILDEEERAQKEFNKYVNRETHRLFNEINHPERR